MAVKTFTTEVLTSADTNTYLANSGLVYVTSTALSGASTTITNCFSSTYDAYRCVLTNVLATNSWIGIQLGSTTTGYYFAGVTASYANGNYVGGYYGNNGASWGATGPLSSGSITGGSVVDIFNPFLTTETSFSSTVHFLNTASGYAGTVAGFQNSDTSFTGMTIAGTSMSGTITIYGYRKG